MKADEEWFLSECIKRVGYANEQKETPRDIINEKGFSIHPKRALYLLRKWSDKGIYNYGVSLDLGWMEKKEG